MEKVCRKTVGRMAVDVQAQTLEFFVFVFL